MFDMQHVGKTISNLRKAQNMTQMELADKLNISFQAVSNWERGQTMPDIAKLGELAAIFGVTIDELLGNAKSAQVVEKLIKEEPVPQKLTAEEFLEVAPLIKPRQAERLWESVKADITLKDLVMAAPFISEGVLDALALEAAAKDKSFDSLLGLLPFLSEEAVDACVEKILSDGLDIKKVIMATPFLSQESIDRLADRIVEMGGVADMVALAPFLGKETLSKAAVRFVEQKGFSALLPLMPFLDGDELDSFFLDKWKKS